MSTELKKALYNISALADLGQAITSENDFHEKIQSVLYVITGTFLANKGALLFYDKTTNKLSTLTQKGFAPADLNRLNPKELMSLGRNEPYLIGDDPVLAVAGAEILTPLWVRDEFIGALLLSGKLTVGPYTLEDLELLNVIANQIAIALNNHSLFMDLSDKLEENRKLYEEMRHIYHGTLQAFAAAIDAKDAYTKNHSHRVAKYSAAIARELGWDEHEIEGMYVAGYLHDVGKLAISNTLLNKVTPFTPEERAEIRKHSTLSHSITAKIKFPWKNVEDIVWHHHERLDGRGYPEALAQESLSDGVRILSLADSFDAMTSQRPYREKMDVQSAIGELRKNLESQFDHKVMLVFCKVLDKEIKGELPEPDILPHLDRDSDLSVISALLEGIIAELSTP
ncbi:MAG: HD domain-containing protein [Smithellaceae bacterium]|nr:HD domain-containing protein [Smithellaceae bacterium]